MSLYRIGLVRHLFFTCDECVYVGFSLTKQQAFFWKVSSNSCLIGCDQLYTGHASGSSREKGLIKLTVTWRSGNNEVVSSTRPTMANTPILRICTKYYTSNQPPFEIPNTSPRDPTHLYNTRTQDNKFLFLFLAVLCSRLEFNFDKICQNLTN